MLCIVFLGLFFPSSQLLLLCLDQFVSLLHLFVPLLKLFFQLCHFFVLPLLHLFVFLLLLSVVKQYRFLHSWSGICYSLENISHQTRQVIQQQASHPGFLNYKCEYLSFNLLQICSYKKHTFHNYKLPQRSTYPSKACAMQTLRLDSAMFSCDILDIINFQTVMTQVATYLFVILMFFQMVIEVIPSFPCVATSNKQTKLLKNYCCKTLQCGSTNSYLM